MLRLFRRRRQGEKCSVLICTVCIHLYGRVDCIRVNIMWTDNDFGICVYTYST